MLYAIYTQATIWMVLVGTGGFIFERQIFDTGHFGNNVEMGVVIAGRLFFAIAMVIVWLIWRYFRENSKHAYY